MNKTPPPCSIRSFPNGDTECRICGALAPAGEQMICRSTGLARVELEQPRIPATGTHD